jgi:tRNA A-37 threonylcarbamoyl transferase component Bud32
MGVEEGILLANRYRLLSMVGRGGMGIVWRAHDEVLDREVAVKQMALPDPRPADADRPLRHRLIGEAQATAALRHPSVAAVHDVVEQDGRAWIVMELLHARSLQRVIDHGGPLEPRRVAAIGRSVLSALMAAHTAGILHRDVKPSNVLLTKDGRVVLTDFGLAISKGEGACSRFSGLDGSPPYVSPERVLGEPTTEASDLWSLGATLYTAVEGHSPYGRHDPLASLIAVLIEEYTPPRRAGPLRPVIDGLLAKNPADRPTAEQAARQLDHIVRHGRSTRRRARMQIGAIAGVTLVAAIVGGVGTWSSRWNSVGAGDTVAFSDSSSRNTVPYRGPGFSMDVPAGWKRVERADGIYWFDPAGVRYLRVSRVSGDPLRGLRVAERRGLAARAFPGYRKLRLEAAPELGRDAAEWEFTWDRGRRRGLETWVGGHDFFFVGPDDHWTPSQRRYYAVLESFRSA